MIYFFTSIRKKTYSNVQKPNEIRLLFQCKNLMWFELQTESKLNIKHWPHKQTARPFKWPVSSNWPHDVTELEHRSSQINAKCDTAGWRWHHRSSLATAPTGGVYFGGTLLSLACGCHISLWVTTEMLWCTSQTDAAFQTMTEATANSFTREKKRIYWAKECGNTTG